ncbi:MAG: hypothetical protein WCH40_02180 [Verrucomicrobiales bacterium]
MSLLDMTTSSRGMLIVGVIVGLFVVGGFTTLYSTGGEKAMGGEKSLEGIIHDEEKELDLNRTAVVEATKRLETADHLRATAKEADELALKVRASRQRISDLENTIPKLERAISDGEKTFETDKQLIRKQLLAELSVTTLPTLQTASGKVYQEARITSIDATSVTLSHRDGSSRLPLTDLPPEIRKRFP